MNKHTHDGPLRPRLQSIIASAALLADVSRAELLSERRMREVVDARQAACLVAREHGYSYPAIGRAIKRDHTTALHGERAARRRAESCPRAADFVACLREMTRQDAERRARNFAAAMAKSDRKRTAPATSRRKRKQPSVRAARPPATADAGGMADFGRSPWWAENNARFVAAMRAAHPELEVAV